jgi:hypothetical protein
MNMNAEPNKSNETNRSGRSQFQCLFASRVSLITFAPVAYLKRSMRGARLMT